MLQDTLAQLANARQSAGERSTAEEGTWAETQLPDVDRPPSTLLRIAADAMIIDLSGGQVRFVHQLIQEFFTAVAWQARVDHGDDLRLY